MFFIIAHNDLKILVKEIMKETINKSELDLHAEEQAKIFIDNKKRNAWIFRQSIDQYKIKVLVFSIQYAMEILKYQYQYTI